MFEYNSSEGSRSIWIVNICRILGCMIMNNDERIDTLNIHTRYIRRRIVINNMRIIILLMG